MAFELTIRADLEHILSRDDVDEPGATVRAKTLRAKALSGLGRRQEARAELEPIVALRQTALAAEFEGDLLALAAARP